MFTRTTFGVTIKSQKKLTQYIKNNVCRRQDLPEALRYYHYLCCFRVDELNKLNSELINSKYVSYNLK